MCLEKTPDQCITLSDVSLDVFEPPNAWDLFRKDAMQLGINPMSLDRNPNEFARSDLNQRAAQGAFSSRKTCWVWESITAATSTSLLGKYGYNEPMLTPATSPILLVLTQSYLRIRQRRDSGIRRPAISERARKLISLRSRFSELSPVTT
jgi:hypothetical protein